MAGAAESADADVQAVDAETADEAAAVGVKKSRYDFCCSFILIVVFISFFFYLSLSSL